MHAAKSGTDAMEIINHFTPKRAFDLSLISLSISNILHLFT
jgi:hypothetical protein